jgi:YbgC/YbaW family acyl-CoA thioester hydrolase
MLGEKNMKFERSFTVEWGDCDEAGIVFYPNYFYWFDCTFQAFLRSKGLSQRELRSRYGAVTPLVDVGATFRAPIRYDDVIVVSAEVEEWAARRMRLRYVAHCGERIVATGFEVRAWALLKDDGGLKGASVPDDFKALFSQQP